MSFAVETTQGQKPHLPSKSGYYSSMWRAFTGVRAHTFSVRSNSRFFSQNAAPKKKIGMKELVKEYGWTATGVYIALSLVDLPLSFALVHSAGQDQLEKWEVSARRLLGADPTLEHTYVRKATSGGKSLFWAEFGIAYIIHKALIVIRVPITVALTPRIANKLGQWGFNVKRAMPTMDQSQVASQVASAAANSNSAAVRKAAELMAKKGKLPSQKALDEAAKAVESSVSGSSDRARRALNDARSQIEKQVKK